MQDPLENTVLDVVGLLVTEFSSVNSISELHQTTVDVATDLFDADICAIAELENCGLELIASSPPDWEDTDGLLSPASLPSICAMEGKSHVIDDLSDTRSVGVAKSKSEIPAETYRSVFVVPFGEDTILLVGNTSPAAFTESDADIGRLVCTYASAHLKQLKEGSDRALTPETMRDAISTLSHDARNFLSIIQGRVALAREDPQPEHFNAIERAATRLGDLLDDSRTLAMTGEHITDIEPVDLDDLVHRTWLNVQTDHSTLYANELSPIYATESRLSQLFENLFRNAIEHAGPDCTVWVGMLPTEPGFYVEDDGPGIRPEKREEVFDVGYSDSSEGSGLGLSIVQRIADAHGWDATVTNCETGGARFEVTGVETSQE